MYSIPPDGVVKAHWQKYRAGEPVFADKNGTPVILVKCGNPLTMGPLPTAGEPYTPELTPEAEMVPGTVPSADAFFTMTPTEPLFPEVVALATPPVAGKAAQPLLSAQSSIGALLGFLPLVGVAHSSSSGPPPVPEPCSMLALAAGAGWLIRKQKR